MQRLAGQALGAQTSGAPRIRPAAGGSAQAPVSGPTDGDGSPGTQPLDSPTVGPTPSGLPQELTNVIRSAGERTVEPPSNVSRATEARAHPAFATRQMPGAPAPADFADKAPAPLLEELQLTSAPPAIARVTSAPPPAATTLNVSRTEPTEVHVHIGRIEVIAAPEPAAPKKSRTTQVRNTLPLADYLARRRRS